MTDDAPDPHGDDRIEELLGQLQGIFGKLSREEKAGEKDSDPEEQQPPITATPLMPPPEPIAPPMAVPPASIIPMEAPVSTAPTLPNELAIAPGHTPVMIGYPVGRDTEAKIFSGKLETMAPKFTKVAFHLGVRWMVPYDPKQNWRQTLDLSFYKDRINALFIIVDHPMDESKRKSLSAELDQAGIYFQEVPFVAIEKKAFYMDLLLGLIFFFDSHKPSLPPPQL